MSDSYPNTVKRFMTLLKIRTFEILSQYLKV